MGRVTYVMNNEQLQPSSAKLKTAKLKTANIILASLWAKPPNSIPTNACGVLCWTKAFAGVGSLIWLKESF